MLFLPFYFCKHHGRRVCGKINRSIFNYVEGGAEFQIFRRAANLLDVAAEPEYIIREALPHAGERVGLSPKFKQVNIKGETMKAKEGYDDNPGAGKPEAVESPAEKLESNPPTGSLIPGTENPESEEIKQERNPNTE